MGSYKDPVRGVPDPYKDYRVEEIGDKLPKKGLPPGEEPPEEKGLLTYVLKSIQKGIEKFLDHLGGSSTEYASAVKTLVALKTALEVLKLEDRSQDTEFLKLLARHWNLAIEESVEYKNHDAAPLFKVFAKKILSYPPNEAHTFGYYLTEHAGQKWIPFPYMELVQKIHHEHEKNPASSPLAEWVKLLADTIRLLQGS